MDTDMKEKEKMNMQMLQTGLFFYLWASAVFMENINELSY
jgi:hypothetical protein